MTPYRERVSTGQATLAATAFSRPAAELDGLLRGYHGYRYDAGQPNIHYGLPSTSLVMVIALDRPLDVGWLGDSSSRDRHWAMAAGLGVHPAAIYQDGLQHGIQLDLTPLGARALLGIPAAGMCEQLVPLEVLIHHLADRIRLAVARESTWPARFASLDRELIALATAHRDRPSPDRTLQHAWRLLHDTGGRLPIRRVAAEVGWSRPHLTRRFTDEYGVGPKQLARVIRFDAARSQLLAGERSLAEVAVRCGYADQAHLSREWRQLAGLSPTAWIAKERPFVQEIQTVG
jgi:AraC-like DNA-binding protein